MLLICRPSSQGPLIQWARAQGSRAPGGLRATNVYFFHFGIINKTVKGPEYQYVQLGPSIVLRQHCNGDMGHAPYSNFLPCSFKLKIDQSRTPLTMLPQTHILLGRGTLSLHSRPLRRLWRLGRGAPSARRASRCVNNCSGSSGQFRG